MPSSTYSISRGTAPTAAERALATSEARFRTLSTASPLGIFFADRSGACTYANARLASIWQRSESEMIGRGYTSRIHPDDAVRAEAAWRTAVHLFTAHESEYRLLLDDRTVRHVHVKVAPIPEGDAFTGFVGTVEDVTERRALASRVRQQERMESLGTLAGGIAHDFNNMIGIILGNAELALLDAGENGLLRDSLGAIRTTSLRARDLIRQMLAYSRGSAHESSAVDFTGVVVDAINVLRATSFADIPIETSLHHGPIMVHGDAAGLNQVIMNLCMNAEYAMRGGENARLFLSLHVEERGLSRQAILVVRDTGAGVPSSARDRVLEPFFTTKPVGAGTGMGLAVADGIVRAHGGTLSLESEPGEGAVFAVRLPMLSLPVLSVVSVSN